MTTIAKHTVITLTTDDLPFEPVLDFEPAEWIDPVVYKREDGSYTVAYAVPDHDGWSSNPLDDTGVEFEEFTTEWDRDAYYHDTDLTTHTPYVVDHFEHSSHNYTLAGTLEYLGMYYHFDSKPSCVLRVPVDFTDTEAAAKSLLEEYTNWSNGDVYGIVRQDFEADGTTRTDAEHVWGFIGSEYAESVVKDIDSHL